MKSMSLRGCAAPRIAVLLTLFAVVPVAAAGERSDLFFTNGLDEEIVVVRVKYATPYDEPRYSSSRVCLPPGADWRIGVQGARRPERILLDLATKTYDFADLGALEPDGDMRLAVAHEGGAPVLRRLEAGNAAVQGVGRDYLTAANRPNAVDRDFLTDAATWDAVRGLVVETAADARERLGEVKTFDLEAGPILNNDHAKERCPEAVEEWNGANDGGARWTGGWRTTVPGAMSVCGCVAGAAGLEGTLFEEDAGWGPATRYFPVIWKEWFGAARVQALDNDDAAAGIGIALRFRLPEDKGAAAAMLEELMDDLRVDGFRPWRFEIRVRDVETETSREDELLFHKGGGDKYDDQAAMQERLFAAHADGTLAEASAVWVTEDAFGKAKAKQEPPASRGVKVMFSRGTFEAVFVPDGRMLMQ